MRHLELNAYLGASIFIFTFLFKIYFYLFVFQKQNSRLFISYFFVVYLLRALQIHAAVTSIIVIISKFKITLLTAAAY